MSHSLLLHPTSSSSINSSSCIQRHKFVLSLLIHTTTYIYSFWTNTPNLPSRQTTSPPLRWGEIKPEKTQNAAERPYNDKSSRGEARYLRCLAESGPSTYRRPPLRLRRLQPPNRLKRNIKQERLLSPKLPWWIVYLGPRLRCWMANHFRRNTMIFWSKGGVCPCMTS